MKRSDNSSLKNKLWGRNPVKQSSSEHTKVCSGGRKNFGKFLLVLFMGTAIIYLVSATTIISDIRGTFDDIVTGNLTVSGNLTAKTGRTVTVVVAANDSSATSKAQADYVCDGVNDQVEIQEAIDGLPSGGGKVLLMEGTFTMGDWNEYITGAKYSIMLSRNNIVFIGSGPSTILKATDGNGYGSVIYAYNKTDIVVKNLKIDGNTLGGADAVGISFYISKKILLKNCFIEQVNRHFVGIYGSSSVVVSSNFFNISGYTPSSGCHGIDLDFSNSVYNVDVTISNNHVYIGEGSRDCSRVENSERVVYSGNHFECGVALECASNDDVVYIKDVLITSNIFKGSLVVRPSGYVKVMGNIIYNGNIATGGVKGTIILSGNKIHNSGSYGISVINGSKELLVVGNYINESNRHGIFVNNVEGGVIILDNIVQDTAYAYDAISVLNTNNVVVRGNKITGGNRAGIYLNCSNDSIIESNVGYDNAMYGLYIENSNNNQIIGNVAYDTLNGFSQDYGFYEDVNSSGNYYVNNWCYDNTKTDYVFNGSNQIFLSNKGYDVSNFVGKVGIGTNSPNNLLTINGTGMIQLQANTTSLICNSSNAGTIYYDGVLTKHRGCNSTDWNDLY